MYIRRPTVISTIKYDPVIIPSNVSGAEKLPSLASRGGGGVTLVLIKTKGGSKGKGRPHTPSPVEIAHHSKREHVIASPGALVYRPQPNLARAVQRELMMEDVATARPRRTLGWKRNHQED